MILVVSDANIMVLIILVKFILKFFVILFKCEISPQDCYIAPNLMIVHVVLRHSNNIKCHRVEEV